MSQIELKAERREAAGSEAARKLRRKDCIPANVYGGGIDPLSLSVAYKDFYVILQNSGGANALINLQVPGAKRNDRTVIIKEIQQHPVTDRISHIDFQVISLTEKIRVMVALHETGESPGVVKGGILDYVHHQVEIECLPTEIPARIDVDISTLDFGHAIHVRDLKLPANVTCTLEQDEVVYTVKAPREEKEPEPTEGEAIEPEVIKKGKTEELEGEGKAEGAEPSKSGEKKAADSKDSKKESNK